MKVVLSGLKVGQVVEVRAVEGGVEVALDGALPRYVMELKLDESSRGLLGAMQATAERAAESSRDRSARSGARGADDAVVSAVRQVLGDAVSRVDARDLWGARSHAENASQLLRAAATCADVREQVLADAPARAVAPSGEGVSPFSTA